MNEASSTAIWVSVIGGTASILAAVVPAIIERRAKQTGRKLTSTKPQVLLFLSIFAIGASVTALVAAILLSRPPVIHSGYSGTTGSQGEMAKGVHVELKDSSGAPLFRKPPKVVVGFYSLDVTTGTPDTNKTSDIPGITPPPNRSTLRVSCGVSNITTDGFDITFATHVDGRVHGGGVSWIAYED
jgi:H-type lectin domain